VINVTPLMATTVRVLTQLRRDPRTMALLLAVPVVLIALVHAVFDQRPGVFQQIGVPLVGLFPLMSMFIVTSITMLRERTSGTLERLMTLPMAKLDLLLGYALAFGVLAAVQTLVVSVVAFGLLDLETQWPLPFVVGLAVLNALHGMSFGLFLSAFARSEFQAVQFLPAFLLPQLLLSGLLGPREQMARGLEICSDFLPMTYAYDALRQASLSASLDDRMLLDVAVVVGSTLLALALGAATLRRRTV
jgi:ABC-2 type transport system permease protein